MTAIQIMLAVVFFFLVSCGIKVQCLTGLSISQSSQNQISGQASILTRYIKSTVWQKQKLFKYEKCNEVLKYSALAGLSISKSSQNQISGQAPILTRYIKSTVWQKQKLFKYEKCNEVLTIVCAMFCMRICPHQACVLNFSLVEHVFRDP